VKSFGVVLNEVQLKQEAMVLGFKESFKQIHPAMQGLIRLSAVLRLSADAMGASERMAGTYMMQMQELRAHVADLADNLGAVLLPTAAFAIGELNTLLGGAADNTADLSRHATRFGLGIINLAKKIGIVIAPIIDWFSGLFNAWKMFIHGMIAGVAKLASYLPGTIGKVGREVAREFGASAAAAGQKSFKGFWGALTLSGQSRMEQWGAGARTRFLEQQMQRQKLMAGRFERDNLADRMRETIRGMVEGLKSAFPSLAAKTQDAAKKAADTIRSAGAREIMFPYMSVAGLSIGANPVLNQLQMIRAEQQETNRQLGRIRRDNGLP